MAQYIDKSALVAKIENKIKKYMKRGEESDAKRDGYGMYWGGVLSCLNEIRTLCDTIEVKEVQEEPVSEELEEAARKIGQKYFPNENCIWARPNYEAMAAANAFKEGYLAGQEKIINKSCEWLENHNNYICGGTNGTSWYDMQQLVKDFKKAMEK